MAHITVKIDLQPYGKVQISGEVKQDLWADRETEGAAYSPFDVRGLKVVDEDGEVLQGSYEKDGKKYQACSLDQVEVEMCEDALIDKYIDGDSAKADYLNDELATMKTTQTEIDRLKTELESMRRKYLGLLEIYETAEKLESFYSQLLIQSIQNQHGKRNHSIRKSAGSANRQRTSPGTTTS